MRMISLAVAALIAATTPLAAQTRPDPTALLEAQRQALAPLARMDGVWRGTAWTITRNGRHEITQTERIGAFLGGSVKVIEGRGYGADGGVSFNALGIISYNPATSAFTMTSWAQGSSGVFPFRPTGDGYAWEVPAGPGATIHYTATIGEGTLREVGYLVAGAAPPRQIFEMNLRRVGDTSWPSGDPVPMR